MSPIITSILLGLTAALANGLGGAVIVKKNWDRRYLQYFIALGSGFMLGTALLEMLPESIRLAGPKAPILILIGYFIVHFFEHTVGGHFHFGEETHAEEFVRPHRGYSVLFGLIIHTFFDGIAIFCIKSRRDSPQPQSCWPADAVSARPGWRRPSWEQQPWPEC